MTHVDHFLAEPTTHLPARRTGSIRRTSHVDMITHVDGTLELRGAASDPGGAVSCRALVRSLRDRVLTTLELDPDVARSEELLGLVVGRGFRAVVDDLCEPATLPWVVLSELPIAALLSGYASLYTGEYPSPLPDAMVAGFPVDICAGWAAPGSFMMQIRSTRDMPTPSGPAVPAGDLNASWHPMPPLAPGSMRRQRLLSRDGNAVWAMFRDSYAPPEGPVTVLHEYTLTATLTDDDRIATCVAVPRVLPWTECPQAAASAGRLVGRSVSELRAMVKEELVGTSTCTHLNDLLSSLAQLDHLVESPRAAQGR